MALSAARNLHAFGRCTLACVFDVAHVITRHSVATPTQSTSSDSVITPMLTKYAALARTAMRHQTHR
eukprot:11203230-Alexandrium_andersonii.AAC.1